MNGPGGAAFLESVLAILASPHPKSAMMVLRGLDLREEMIKSTGLVGQWLTW